MPSVQNFDRLYPMNKPLAKSLAYLSSREALAAVAVEPYWPKWDSPWWHMSLLFELGLAELIPRPLTAAMVAALNSHYLRFFPFREREVPAGKNPVTHVMCHCALGNICQILAAAGVDVEADVSWARPWFARYQLPDGGLNCDEAAYTKANPKSSLVSTVPALEYMVAGPLSEPDREFLRAGFAYLARHRLVRSTGGALLDPEWMRVCFPRFYFLDILRALSVLLAIADRLELTVPAHAVAEAVGQLETKFPDGRVHVERQAFRGVMTRTAASGFSERAPASEFALLACVSEPGSYNEALTAHWRRCRELMATLARRSLLTLP